MNVKNIRILCMLLLLVMLVGAFAACKSEEPESGQTQEDATLPPADPGSQSEQDRYRPEKVDLEGYTYRMVVDGGLDRTHSWYSCVDDDGEDVLDEAFFNRNNFLENYFNIGIEFRSLGSTPYQMKTELRACVMGNEDFADIVLAVAGDVMNVAIPEGLVLNLNNMNGFNLDASYWDQRIQKEYSINNMLFTLEGDYTTYDEMTTFVVFFNDFLYDQFGYYETYGSLYDMVKNGTWTLEVLMEMVRGTSSEDEDIIQKRWGMYAERPVPYIFYLGSGNHVIIHDDDGILRSVFDDKTAFNNTYTILEDTIQKIGINEDVVLIDQVSESGIGIGWSDFFKGFANNRALFETSTLEVATYISDMQELFGVLPIPKYTTDQEEYFSWCSSQSHLPLMVPATALTHNHTDNTARITEAMCYFSKYPFSEKTQTVVDAEYEWMMLNKVCRTYDDLDMLEIIFANKTYDLDFATYMSGIPQIVVNHTGHGTLDRLAAELKSYQGATLGKLTQFVRETTTNVKN